MRCKRCDNAHNINLGTGLCAVCTAHDLSHQITKLEDGLANVVAERDTWKDALEVTEVSLAVANKQIERLLTIVHEYEVKIKTLTPYRGNLETK